MKDKNLPEDYLEIRKNKKMKKHKKRKRITVAFYVKWAVIFFIVQLLIILLGFVAQKSNMPVSEKDTYTICFTPDKVEYKESIGIGRFSQSDKNLYIYSDGKEYMYGNLFSYQYIGDSLKKDLMNDTLTATIEKDTERVVALRGEKANYYSIDDFNHSAIIRFSLGWIVMLVIEGVFAFVVLFFIFRYVKEPIKRRKNIENKKIKKDKQREKYANNIPK